MNVDICIIMFFIIIATIIKVLPIKEKIKNNVFINIGFIVLFIILIIREPYSDMIRYLEVFKETNINTFSDILRLRWEPLYLLLNLAISIFTDDERIFMIIIAILGLVGPYIFIKRYSKGYLFSLVFFIILGIYNYNFYIIRQALAISILLIGIKYIEQKSLIKFIIMVLLATGFHTTSIIFLIAYPLGNIKLSTKGIILYIFIIGIVFLLGNNIVQFIYKIPIFTEYATTESKSDGIWRLVLLTTIFLFMFVLTHFNNKNQFKSKKIITLREKEDTNTVFFNMLMIGIIFQILSINQSVIVRLANVFVAPVIVLIPNMLALVNNKNNKYLFYVGILICAIVYSILVPTIKAYEIGGII